MKSYISAAADWRAFIKDKWLLFDNDAIVALIEYHATDVFKELLTLNVICSYIHPVLLELMNTDSSKKLAERLLLLETYFEGQLPIKEPDFNRAREIQKKLGYEYRPSPTDLYLASVLAGQNDFPYPHFKRDAYLTLQTNKNSRVLGFLSADPALH